jgi:hypothetical protein
MSAESLARDCRLLFTLEDSAWLWAACYEKALCREMTIDYYFQKKVLHSQEWNYVIQLSRTFLAGVQWAIVNTERSQLPQ